MTSISHQEHLQEAHYDANDHDAQNSDRASEMRTYLEGTHRFSWKDGSTECTLPYNTPWPFIEEGWLDTKRKSKTAIIRKFRANPSSLNFKYSFAVKEIFVSTRSTIKSEAEKEVANMKGLSYPHIVALLGTFRQNERLHILIYPAAPCDLADLMDSISDEFKRCGTDSHSPTLDVHPGGTTDQALLEVANDITERDKDLSARSCDVGILGRTMDKRITALISYFVCLCQALAYLHSHNVRHKDIKPENVLIDSVGSPILTDFGIAKRFEKDMPHVTNDEVIRTARYQSPEKRDGLDREDSDDVFSLGCVFLEMISIILGMTRSSCNDHFSSPIKGTGRNMDFCSHLDKLPEWIRQLSKSSQTPGGLVSNGDLDAEQAAVKFNSLETITKMLDQNPKSRPVTLDLYRDFDFPGQKKCRDCHPDHGEAWKITDIPKCEALNSGLSSKRSSRHASGDHGLSPDENADSLPSLQGLSQNSSPRRHLSLCTPRRGPGSIESPRRPDLLRQSYPSSSIRDQSSFQRQSFQGIDQNIENSMKRSAPPRISVSGPTSEPSQSPLNSGDQTGFSDADAIRQKSRPPSPVASSPPSPRLSNSRSSSIVTDSNLRPEWKPLNERTSESDSSVKTSRKAEKQSRQDTGSLMARGQASTPVHEFVPSTVKAGEDKLLDSTAENKTPPTPPQHVEKSDTTHNDSTLGSKESRDAKTNRLKPNAIRLSSSSSLIPGSAPGHSLECFDVPSSLDQQASNQLLQTSDRHPEGSRVGDGTGHTAPAALGLEDVTHNRENLDLKNSTEVLLYSAREQMMSVTEYWKIKGQSAPGPIGEQADGTAGRERLRIYKMPQSGEEHDVYHNGIFLVNVDFRKLGWWTWSHWKRRMGIFSYLVIVDYD